MAILHHSRAYLPQFLESSSIKRSDAIAHSSPWSKRTRSTKARGGIKRSDAIACSSPLLTTDISRSGTRHQTLRRDSTIFTIVEAVPFRADLLSSNAHTP